MRACDGMSSCPGGKNIIRSKPTYQAHSRRSIQVRLRDLSLPETRGFLRPLLRRATKISPRESGSPTLQSSIRGFGTRYLEATERAAYELVTASSTLPFPACRLASCIRFLRLASTISVPGLRCWQRRLSQPPLVSTTDSGFHFPFRRTTSQ